jgi:dTDP-glucose pyrophosphorylase
VQAAGRYTIIVDNFYIFRTTMKTTLLIIAAGMGSRYGGLKQIDSVGPDGEIIIDYSMFDAVKAGFDKIVFVIRHHFEDAFREKIGSKLDGIVEAAYAYQELDSCLGDFQLPPNREKPWGTGHAILVTKDVVKEPFAVINADDYYGPNSFKVMKNYLSDSSTINDTHYAMVGFILRNTLSEHGHVARGVCQADKNMLLQKVTECTKIKKQGTGAVFIDDQNREHILNGDEIVSMNLWGFHPSVFKHIQKQFDDFLAAHGQKEKSELFIPSVVDELINGKQITAKVLTTQDRWFGVTYKEDMLFARESIEKLISRGIYPEKLWSKI